MRFCKTLKTLNQKGPVLGAIYLINETQICTGCVHSLASRIAIHARNKYNSFFKRNIYCEICNNYFSPQKNINLRS
jgi:hypothetical protein